jgi:hypothetical protein
VCRKKVQGIEPTGGLHEVNSFFAGRAIGRKSRVHHRTEDDAATRKRPAMGGTQATGEERGRRKPESRVGSLALQKKKFSVTMCDRKSDLLKPALY